MRLLTIDTETTGFPNTEYSVNHPSQPEVLSLGWILSEEATPVSQGQIFIKGSKHISEGAAKCHGLNREFVNAFGVPVETGSKLVNELITQSQMVIGYNIEFDLKMLDILLGSKEGIHRAVKQKCVMQAMTPVCKIMKGNGAGFKFPKLREAYEHCFPGTPAPEYHRALDDCFSTLSIYGWLVNNKPETLVS